MKKLVYIFSIIVISFVLSYQFVVLRKIDGTNEIKIEILSALADITYCSEECSVKPGDCCFKCDVCDTVIDYDEASVKASHCFRKQ